MRGLSAKTVDEATLLDTKHRVNFARKLVEAGVPERAALKLANELPRTLCQKPKPEPVYIAIGGYTDGHAYIIGAFEHRSSAERAIRTEARKGLKHVWQYDWTQIRKMPVR
jgi:hypothetical protein